MYSGCHLATLLWGRHLTMYQRGKTRRSFLFPPKTIGLFAPNRATMDRPQRLSLQVPQMILSSNPHNYNFYQKCHVWTLDGLVTDPSGCKCEYHPRHWGPTYKSQGWVYPSNHDGPIAQGIHSLILRSWRQALRGHILAYMYRWYN